MISTCIYDKNGVEIHEGDTIQHMEYGLTECDPELWDTNLPRDEMITRVVKCWVEEDMEEKYFRCTSINSQDVVVKS